MKGFTLIETVIAIALTALVAVALGTMISYFYKTNEYTLEQTEAVESARRGIASAMKALREASYGADGSYPITAAATSSLTFYADVNDDGIVEKVTDWLSGTTLYETVTDPTSTPLTYTGGQSATSTIATYVENGTSTPLFTYYDDTGALLAPPVNIADVASVETTVVVDVNVNRAPVAFTLTSGATLRNLRNQQ